MKRTIAIAIIFLFLFIATLFAETSIKAEVNKTIITTEELLTYKLTISSSEKQLPQAQIPKFDGFKVVSHLESSNISFIKNKIQTAIVYNFILVPTGTGKFRIKPSSIKIRNQTYATSAFEIEVKPGKSIPKIEPEQKPSLPKEIQPESEQPRITL